MKDKKEFYTMHKIIFTLILLISYINADSIWDLEQKSPIEMAYLKLSSHQSSPNGKIFSSLYTSTKVAKEGESRKQYLQISTSTKKWWMSNTWFFTISKISFTDNKLLLIIQNSSTTTQSSLINIETKKQEFLTGGVAEYTGEGKDKGLFIIHDRKGYLPAPENGAFWVDEIRDKNGELIEVLSKQKNN